MRDVPFVIDILRHGEAEPSSPDGDGARPLSDTGVAQVRALARRLAAGGWSPDRLFTSPLRRARDTARLIAAELAAPPAIEMLDELLPEADPAALCATLEGLGAGRGHVVLVSHMPFVSRLSGFLSGRSEAFMPADLARLESEEGLRRGRAAWRGFPGRADSG